MQEAKLKPKIQKLTNGSDDLSQYLRIWKKSSALSEKFPWPRLDSRLETLLLSPKWSASIICICMDFVVALAPNHKTSYPDNLIDKWLFKRDIYVTQLHLHSHKLIKSKNFGHMFYTTLQQSQTGTEVVKATFWGCKSHW